MELKQIYSKAAKVMPEASMHDKNLYVKGFIDGMLEAQREPEGFYYDLAQKMRELWPPGNKGGKWPWRESAKTLAERLKFIWTDRNLKGKYTIDDCLATARRYLAQFEENTTYMQTLKYFVFKQEILKSGDNKGKVTYTSKFADMLEQNVDITDHDLFSEEDLANMSEGELV